jgi:hypothetical protein
VTGHDPSRVSPFGDPRIKAWSTAPRGFSQPPTSFIGIWRQGIHRWLFVAWESLFPTTALRLLDARAHSSVLNELTRQGTSGATVGQCAGGRAGVQTPPSAGCPAVRGESLPHNETVFARCHRTPVVPTADRSVTRGHVTGRPRGSEWSKSPNNQ